MPSPSVQASMDVDSHFHVRVDTQDEMLEVTVLQADATAVSLFPFVWLRDNCLSPQSFHPGSSSRLTSFSKLDLQ